MLRFRLFASLCLSALCLALPIRPAWAAQPPAPAVVPAADPLKAAFEALPEGQRRDLQDALVWTGDFNGAVAGSFGPRTRDALLAHARRIGLAPEAALSAAARSKLLTAAASARTRVGFGALRDTRAGFSIGLPSTLLPIRTAIPDGTRYAAPDSSFVVDLVGRAAEPGALDDVFARLTRDAPGRHVTYKLAKPDFVVVSGEIGDRKFYSRYATGTPAGGVPTLRGFTLSYPADVTEMDRLVLAVAAAFDPFPSAVPEGRAAPQAATPASPPGPAAVLAGQAVLVGPGLALTRTDPKRCRDAEADGMPVSWIRQDPDTGLALVSLKGHRGVVPVRISATGPGAGRRILFFVPGQPSPSLAIASVSDAGADRIIAPLQGADGGALVVDEAGDLAGLVEPTPGRGSSVAGVVTSARYDVVGGERLSAFLRSASVPVAAAGAPAAGETLMARWQGSVLPLRCAAASLAP